MRGALLQVIRRGPFQLCTGIECPSAQTVAQQIKVQHVLLDIQYGSNCNPELADPR